MMKELFGIFRYFSFGNKRIKMDETTIEIKRTDERQFQYWEKEYRKMSTITDDFIEQTLDYFGNKNVELTSDSFRAHEGNDNVDIEKVLEIQYKEQTILAVIRSSIQDDENTQYSIKITIKKEN